MTMKENHNPTIYSSNYRNEADPLPFGVKEIYLLHDPQKGTDTIEFDINDRDVHCNSKILIRCSDDNDIGRIHSPADEIPCSLLQFRGPGVSDSLPSEKKDREKFLTSAALESLIVEEYPCSEESEFNNSGAKPVTKADLLGRHTHSYTDKNALECRLPELVVCDKKVNDLSVKDICIDDGMPANDKNLTRSCEDDHSGGGRADREFIISNRLVLSLENIESSQSMSNPLAYNSFDENTAEKCDPESSTQTDEVICNATRDMLTDSSEEESIADKKLPVQDFGKLKPLRFFSEPLNGKGDKTAQPLDQLQSPSGKEDSESPVSLSVEVEQREDNQPENISCDSELERGSTSDFNYSAPIQTCIITDNVKEQSEETVVVDAYAHDKNADDISDSGTRDSRTEVVEKQAVEHKPENYENSPNASQVHCINGNSENSPNASQVQTPVSTDDQLVEQRAMKHDRKDSDDVSIYNKQLQHGEGESSFSSAGLVTYSGPVAYSGSLSLRSDGSATSGKSFAFPLLQSEWNSSPVRMTKADRRHYRKQKDWRSSILCCRF